MPFFFFFSPFNVHLVLARSLSHFRPPLDLERQPPFSPHNRAALTILQLGVFHEMFTRNKRNFFSCIVLLRHLLLYVFHREVLGKNFQAHFICAFSPAYLSKEVGTLEDHILHPSLIMPSPRHPNLFILLLYIFKTKGYLLFFQDYILLSLSPGKM